MYKFRVLQVKTKAAAHIVVRNGAGKKLFDMWVLGVAVAMAVPSNAEIKVEPNESK
jgi:hypothetical protein